MFILNDDELKFHHHFIILNNLTKLSEAQKYKTEKTFEVVQYSFSNVLVLGTWQAKDILMSLA